MGAAELTGHLVVQGGECMPPGCSSLPVRYVVFPDVSATSLEQVAGTWGEFAAWVQGLPASDTKEACVLVKGATFGNKRTAQGSLRHNDNMQQVYLIEADYDAEVISMEEAANRLRGADIEALLCTTARHSTTAPRWRVFAPLFMSCAPAERKRHVGALNGALGGILAIESFTLSQSYYVGPVKGNEYRTIHVRGEAIDTVATVAEVFPSEISGAHGFSDDDTLPEPVDDETLADISSAIEALAFTRSEEYALCIQVLQNLKHLAWCGYAQEAETLARGFCKRSTKFKDRWFDRKWNRGLHPWRGHFRTIFKLAQEDGWVNPKKIPDSASVLEFLRPMTQTQIIEEWAKHAAPLSPENAELVMLEVERRTGIKKRALNAGLQKARTHLKRERLRKAAGTRDVITFKPENSAAIAQAVVRKMLEKGAPEDLFLYAGQMSRVIESHQPYAHMIDAPDRLPEPTIQIDAHSPVTVRAQVEQHVIFQMEQRTGPVNIAVPPSVIDSVLEIPVDEMPRVAGLLSHPIVLADGSIVARNGLDKRTGLFVHGVQTDIFRPYTQDEAKAALARLVTSFLVGFEFASGFNSHVALAGLVTAIQRRVLDSAPGLAILAPVQSSGKTTLARRIHVLLTGKDMPVVTLPVGHDDEIEKRLLALLLRSPAMVVFDNVTDGLTVNGGAALNGALTAPEFTGRLLGSTRTLCVPSNVFFALTGNNLRLGRDEVSRWLTTTLAPTGARPEQRKFRHVDVVGHAREIRAQVFQDVVGIVSGYLKSGGGLRLNMGSRFAQWDRLVRQPLVWAGADDPALCFQINGDEAEHNQAMRRLILGLTQEFSEEQAFSARQVAAVASGVGFLNSQDSVDLVADALGDLRCRNPGDARSVGRALNAALDRTVSLDGREMRIVVRFDRNGVGSYRVQECGVRGLI